MVINETYYDKVTPAKAIKILKSFGDKSEEVKIKGRTKKS
jgi:hypothetical protein